MEEEEEEVEEEEEEEGEEEEDEEEGDEEGQHAQAPGTSFDARMKAARTLRGGEVSAA